MDAVILRMRPGKTIMTCLPAGDVSSLVTFTVYFGS
jgi:hypothetical protein